MCYSLIKGTLKGGFYMNKNIVRDKIVKVKVTEEEREHYYKLAKIEYNNFADMVKDLLSKYEESLLKKGIKIDEH